MCSSDLGLTATEWLETGVEQSGSYSYIITATTDAGSSEPAQSGLITLGPKLGIPYSCEFSQEEFDKWTIVDANEDDVKWQWFNLSWASLEYFRLTPISRTNKMIWIRKRKATRYSIWIPVLEINSLIINILSYMNRLYLFCFFYYWLIVMIRS